MYVYEVIKEYVIFLDVLDHTIKSRVIKITDEEEPENRKPYMWQVSHHYRPSSNAAGRYYPSKVTASTFEEAERLMMLYIRGFTDIDVKLDENY